MTTPRHDYNQDDTPTNAPPVSDQYEPGEVGDDTDVAANVDGGDGDPRDFDTDMGGKPERTPEEKKRNFDRMLTFFGMLILGAMACTYVIIKWVSGDSGEEPGNINDPGNSGQVQPAPEDNNGSGGGMDDGGSEPTEKDDNSHDNESDSRPENMSDYPVKKDDLFQDTNLAFLDDDWTAVSNQDEVEDIAAAIQSAIDHMPEDNPQYEVLSTQVGYGNKKQVAIYNMAAHQAWHVANLQSYTTDDSPDNLRRVVFTIDDDGGEPMFFVAGYFDLNDQKLDLDTYSATKEGAANGAIGD